MKDVVICNYCGKQMVIVNGIPKEDYLHITKQWGYFSQKDGRYQELDICEECFDNWTKQFQIPVKTIEVTELI